MLKLKMLLLAGLASVSFASGPLLANDAEAVIKYRKAVYTSMKGHMGAIVGVMKGRLTDYEGHLADHAAAIGNAARIIPALFPEGSDQGDTDAKSNIWSDRAGFEEAAQRLEAASQELLTAAQSGDMRAVGKAVGQVGGSCKGCHDTYRQ